MSALRDAVDAAIAKLGETIAELAVVSDRDQLAPFLAAQFCGMTDDAQAQFFVHVARTMGAWKGGGCHMQLAYIGKHLQECACSTPEARQWINDLSDHLREPAPALPDARSQEEER